MSSPRSPRATRRSPLRESHEPEDSKPLPISQSPHIRRRSSRRESHEAEDSEIVSTPHSSHTVEKQISPRLASVKSPRLESPKLIDPPKLPTIQEVRRKRQERDARNTKRWEYLQEGARCGGINALITLAVLAAINVALVIMPYSASKSAELYAIGPGVSTLHNLTEIVVSHSQFQCLNLVLVRNTLTAPAQVYVSAASSLPEGNTSLSTVKASAQAYAARVADASVNAQTLLDSFLGINPRVFSSLDHLISELNSTLRYDPMNHELTHKYPSPESGSPSLLPRRKTRRLLTAHLDELISIVLVQSREAIALKWQFRNLYMEWETLMRPIACQREDVEARIAWRNAELKEAWWQRFPARIFSISDPQITALNQELSALNTFFILLDRDVGDRYSFYKVERNPLVWKRWFLVWGYAITNGVYRGMDEMIARLDVFHKDLLEARNGLAGRTFLWRQILAADQTFEDVENIDRYVDGLTKLKKNLEAESASRQQTCREEFRHVVKNRRAWWNKNENVFDEDFPIVGLK